MDLPPVVRDSGLYGRLQEDGELLNAVKSLRLVTEKLAETIARSVPTFTDHSIRHMDALWRVSDRILRTDELAKFSTAEAFLLAAGFYLHDIGMAYAATAEGLNRIRSSPGYASFMSAVPDHDRSDPTTEARAIAFAVRKDHASASLELANSPVPGTGIYLFESNTIREAWAETCGRIAASHHWSLETVDREIGSPGIVALPGNRKGDLGYVAAILRLVDYAHINRDRAPTIDRAFRQPIEYDSLVHWLAQEQIDGPEREDAELLYRAARPVASVDAWWLYYEMLTGLDAEIRAVKRYLERRAASRERLSLQGVRGTVSPEEASVYIPTDGFLPIEVNLRTGSIDRLVKLLAGESLYGPDPMAAVRELIQNACDAVMLKSAVAVTELDKVALSIPIRIKLTTSSEWPVLEITDWGIGMTKKVMTDYLLSIASDYWASQFHLDFPSVADRGFRPAGKFGIGFLSVFMLGDELTVESNRDGGDRYRLSLRGVGRRGEIRSVQPPPGSGTTVHIQLKEAVVDMLRPLPQLVRAYAPMVPHPLTVDVDGESTTIPVGWLHKLTCEEVYNWTLDAVKLLFQRREGHVRGEDERLWWLDHQRMVWSRRNTEHRNAALWAGTWPEYSERRVRLVAAFEGLSLLSLNGLALQPISTPGFVGVIDVDSATPDISRQRALNVDVKDVISQAVCKIRPQVIAQLNELAERSLLIDELEFIAGCVRVYGREPLLESSIPWISFLKMPGEVQLVSSMQLLDKLTQSRSLFVAYSTGPWTAMRRWVASGDAKTPGELAIVIDDADHAGPHYVDSRDEKEGQLRELWPKSEDTPLFGTILRIAAQAWQVNLQVLTEQDGWRHSGSVVWGYLVRP